MIHTHGIRNNRQFPPPPHFSNEFESSIRFPNRNEIQSVNCYTFIGFGRCRKYRWTYRYEMSNCSPRKLVSKRTFGKTAIGENYFSAMQWWQLMPRLVVDQLKFC